MEFLILSALAELGGVYARYCGRKLMRKLGGYRTAGRCGARKCAVADKRVAAVKRAADERRAVAEKCGAAAGVPMLGDIHAIISEHWDVRHNALSNNLEAKPADLGNEAFESLTERMHNSMVNRVQEVFPLCFRSKIDSYLFSDEVPLFNPLRGYLAELPAWEIDYAQLYAQAVAEIRAGEPTFFSKAEEAEIEAHNKSFYRESPLADAYRKSFAAGGGQQEWLSANEIFEILKRESPKALQGVTIARLGKQLRLLGVAKRHTVQGNLYGVCRRE